MPKEDIQGWVERELEYTMRLIKEGAVPCEGVVKVLEHLEKEGKYNLAVVS